MPFIVGRSTAKPLLLRQLFRTTALWSPISLGNLYNHFPGKHDMLVGIAELEKEELSNFVNVLSGKGPVQRVLTVFIEDFSTYAANRKAAILNLEITAEAMRQKDIANLFMEARKALTDALVSLINPGVGEGVFRTTALNSHTASFILDLVEGNASRALVEGIEIKSYQSKLEKFVVAALKN